LSILLLSLALLLPSLALAQSSPTSAPAPVAPATSATSAAIALLSPEQVAKLLPPSVYFRGQTAPLQLRNAAAARFPDGAILFASLVDTSGYSTSVRERYQFYFVTEAPLTVGDKTLAPGAYGAGFLEDGAFVVMDIGGHDVLLSRIERDDGLHRPRPLQLEAGTTPQELRLYLGRSFVTLTRVPR